MKTKTTIIFISFINVFFSIRTHAQMDPTSSVLKFADYMSEWCQTGDDEFRLKLEDEVFPKIGNNQSGAERCLVDDGLMKIFAQRDTTGLLSQIGTSQVDSYLQALTKAIGVDMQYMHEPPVWHKEYKEPVAFEKKGMSTQFASMDFSTSGFVNYSGKDLFFVQGDKIVKIVDFESPLAKAIRLYSEKKYKEAFPIFRDLAYAEPNNYTAQYYTVVMEIKKNGCGYLNSKVRDTEAAWWIYRAARGKDFSFSISSDSRDNYRSQLGMLYIQFGIDEKTLPYYNTGFFDTMLNRGELVSEGMMPFNKSSNDSHMGYMDESGKVLIPCKFDVAFPFNSSGFAMVILNGKYGYINRRGDMVIPARYDKGCMKFINGNTFVLQGDVLLLIDENGNIVKEIGKGFDSLMDGKLGNNVYAIVNNKNTKELNLFDFDGNFVFSGINANGMRVISW